MRAARRTPADASGGAARPAGPFGPGGVLRSFDLGMGVLPGALAAALGKAVRCDAPVESVGRADDGWRLDLRGGEAVRADAVVVACPSGAAAAMLRPLDARLADAAAGVRAAPVAVASLLYAAAAAPRAAEGYGILCPRGEPASVLGVLFESTVFPGRAPGGRVLLRAMCGGARDPALAALPDEELLATVRADLSAMLGVKAEPLEARVFRPPSGIPQYEVGHGARLAALHAARAAHRGLHLAGNSWNGVSVNATLADAARVAAAVLAEG
jgi:oxygen-dependent protoporphyrinogen oxidase